MKNRHYMEVSANADWVLTLSRAKKPYFSRNNRKAKHRDSATWLWPYVPLIEADGEVYPEAGRVLADQGSMARHLPLDADSSGVLGCRGQRAIPGNAPRHQWQVWHPEERNVCNLQTRQSSRRFESHSHRRALAMSVFASGAAVSKPYQNLS